MEMIQNPSFYFPEVFQSLD